MKGISWVIILGSLTILLLLTVSYDFVINEPVFTTIEILAEIFMSFVFTKICFNQFNWCIVNPVIILMIIIYLVYRLKNKKQIKPQYYNYQNDIFFGWKWSWGWQWSNLENSWKVINLKAYCPKCGNRLYSHNSYFGARFICSNCKFSSEENNTNKLKNTEEKILLNISWGRKKN